MHYVESKCHNCTKRSKRNQGLVYRGQQTKKTHNLKDYVFNVFLVLILLKAVTNATYFEIYIDNIKH